MAVIIAGCCVTAPVWGDEAAPETEGGRYSFSKVADGFVRLDMQSGEVSLCSRRAVGWTCQAVPEDRAVLENEIARLRRENAVLKKEILSRGLPLPAGTLPEPPVVRDGDRAPAMGPRHRSAGDLCRPGVAASGRGDRPRGAADTQKRAEGRRVPLALSPIELARAATVATAVLAVDTPGVGFVDITREVARFVEQIKARDGAVLLFLRHTSASIVIQENADPDVRRDLVTALARLAPADAGWVHDVEGPDDMPAHVKSMLNGISPQCPGERRRIGAGYLAGHLCRRAPRTAAPARGDAAVRRIVRRVET